MRKSVIINKKSIVMCGLALALSAAIYLNWQYQSNGEAVKNNKDDADLGKSIYVSNTVSLPEENDYFSVAIGDREKSRKNTIAELNEIIDDKSSSSEAKQKAEKNKNTIALNIEKEANIETLIKAKGFEKCIAVLNEKSANIIIKAKDITSQQTIQINEIVSEQTEFSPENIKIIAVE
ncbi:MAG: SpoIIIAH-like family protein [Clostridia bacterium]|nr:SpoIIIAH-like family protein [Clostridia bacterium]